MSGTGCWQNADRPPIASSLISATNVTVQPGRKLPIVRAQPNSTRNEGSGCSRTRQPPARHAHAYTATTTAALILLRENSGSQNTGQHAITKHGNHQQTLSPAHPPTMAMAQPVKLNLELHSTCRVARMQRQLGAAGASCCCS